MPKLALSVLGRDRPGIVAAVTHVLLQHGANVEDSQMTILRGHFTMMLLLALPDAADASRLRADLDGVARELGLEALALSAAEELDPVAPESTHVVTVYGADHPGILHAATAALAERDVNITDLGTRLVEEAGGEPLYAVMMEVVVPERAAVEELRRALAEVGESEGVEVSLRELERDVL